MEFILIAIIGLITFFLVKKISGFTKLEPPVIYLIIGILAGVLINYAGKGSITEVFTEIEKYNTVALLFMFFTAGFTINVSQLKKSGKATAKLICFPGYIEAFVVSIVIFFLLRMLPQLGIELGYTESLIVAAIFAVSSAANVVPVSVDLINKGYKGRNNMPSAMIIVSIVDGFITIPIVFVSLLILIAESTGRGMSPVKILIMIVLTLISIALAVLLGIILGRIELFISRPVYVRLSKKNQSIYADYMLILFAFLVAVLLGAAVHEIHSLKEAVSIFGILIMCGMGFAINNFDNTGAGKIIGAKGTSLFQMFGMPVIFIYVGAIMDLKTLMNPLLILVLLAITIIAITIKGTVGKYILKGKKYSDGERKFVARCFIPKGVSLINFSVLFSSILKNNQNLISFMSMLAAAGILFTMTIGLSLMKKSEHLLIKD